MKQVKEMLKSEFSDVYGSKSYDFMVYTSSEDLEELHERILDNSDLFAELGFYTYEKIDELDLGDFVQDALELADVIS